MSIRMMAAVMKTDFPKRVQKYVMLVLADHFNEEEGVARPSVPLIARRASISEEYARKTIRHLEALGYLQTARGGGAGRASQYRILLPENPEQSTGFERAKTQNSVSETRNSVGKTRNPGSGEPLEPLKNPDSGRGATFEEFWKRCPNRVSRQKACLAWGKLTEPERVQAIEHVARWYAQWAAEKPELTTPNPITYLERRAWGNMDTTPKTTAESRAELLRQWADRINGDGYLAPGAPGRATCDELVANGLVTAERIAERCG